MGTVHEKGKGRIAHLGRAAEEGEGIPRDHVRMEVWQRGRRRLVSFVLEPGPKANR